jgi:hypothetical protein
MARSILESLHLRTGAGPGAAVAAIQELASKSGFEVVKNSSKATKTIVVACDAKSPGWVNIYGGLAGLAAHLSNEPSVFFVSLAHVLEDYMVAELYYDGVLVDEYNSVPGYGGDVARADRDDVLGRPYRWEDVIKTPFTPKSLGAVWKRCRNKTELSYRALLGTAEILGISEGCLGPRTFPKTATSIHLAQKALAKEVALSRPALEWIAHMEEWCKQAKELKWDVDDLGKVLAGARGARQKAIAAKGARFYLLGDTKPTLYHQAEIHVLNVGCSCTGLKIQISGPKATEAISLSLLGARETCCWVHREDFVGFEAVFRSMVVPADSFFVAKVDAPQLSQACEISFRCT